MKQMEVTILGQSYILACPDGGEAHSSRRHIAVPLEHSDPRAGARRHFGRAALDSAPIRACSGRGLPRRRSPGCRAWALTPRFQPCLCLPAARLSACGGSSAIGGVVSVALSLGSPRVAVSDLPALWSPDFPPANGVCPPAILRPSPATDPYRIRAATGAAAPAAGSLRSHFASAISAILPACPVSDRYLHRCPW